MKLNQIPTKNKLIIIDNYSPNYNYIIEGDKIYYAKKGNDHWVDISHNNTARKNLFTFINNKYNFKGYEDGESDIFKTIVDGTFNYSDQKSKNNSKPQQNKQSVSQESIPSPIISFDSLNDLKSPFPLYADKVLAEISNQKSKQQPTNNSQSKQQSKVSQKEENNGLSNFFLNATLSRRPHLYNYYKIGKKDNTPQEPINLDWLKIENPESVGAVWNSIIDGDFKTAFDIAYNGVSRQIDKLFQQDQDPISNLMIPGQLDQSSQYAIRPLSFTGDTITKFNQRVSPEQYIIPESLNTNEFTFGYRNRNNYTPIQSEAASITAFHPFKPFGQHDAKYKTFIGIDPQGNLKVGDITNFSEGDILTGTYSNDIAYFMKDEKGNIIMSKSRKNPLQNQPAYATYDNGKIIEKPTGQAINILVRKDDPHGNQYGNVTGGRVLVKVGDELRLLSGSIQDIDKQFEDMKKRNNINYGTFYTLDNGSFNRGLRTFNNQFTAGDLKKYDHLNAQGGNFLYIKEKKQPKLKFKSDTVYTPNVRTVNDDSYKKGHSIINEQQGIVLHHTGFMDNNLKGVTNYLTTPGNNSAHVIIGQDGTRKVLANPNQVTFHAGHSAWNGKLNVNDFMVGIEFQGDTNKKDLTPEQIQSAIEYMEPIIRENNIRLEDIVTHEQVRNLWFDYARKNNVSTFGVPKKVDINLSNYKKIIDELLKRIYYKK